MCYYNGQKVTRTEYIELMQIEKSIKNLSLGDKPVQNGFEYGQTAVLRRNAAGNNFDAVTMEWGFLPSYLKNDEDVKKFRFGYKDPIRGYKPGLTTLNAKGEEMLQPDKMFRKAAKERRCLILSSGFFEWQHIFPLNKKTGQPLKTAVKYPYYISVKGQDYFYMAGIWQPWTNHETGETKDTVAIVTTKANSLMAKVHNSKERMPVILEDELAWEWMMEDILEDRILEIGTTVFPTEKMQACTIEKDFRESLEPTKQFVYEDLPTLVF